MSKTLETRIYDSPIRGDYYITDRFAYTPKREAPHTGIDLVCPAGTPIYGPCLCTVEKKAQDEEGGNYLILKSLSGMYFTYCHLARPTILTYQSTVSPETVIGFVGKTGCPQSEPHLHFSVYMLDLPTPFQIVGLVYDHGHKTYLNPEWFVKL